MIVYFLVRFARLYPALRELCTKLLGIFRGPRHRRRDDTSVSGSPHLLREPSAPDTAPFAGEGHDVVEDFELGLDQACSR
jgi:hypothetical protein